MNLLKNGNFATGDLKHWKLQGGGGIEDLAFQRYREGYAVRLKQGMGIVQMLNNELVSDTRKLIVRVKAKASIEPPEVNEPARPQNQAVMVHIPGGADPHTQDAQVAAKLREVLPDHLNTYFYISVELITEASEIDWPGFGFVASGGMDQFEYPYERRFPGPLVSAFITCHAIRNNPGGPLDPRDIWVTDVELLSAD